MAISPSPRQETSRTPIIDFIMVALLLMVALIVLGWLGTVGWNMISAPYPAEPTVFVRRLAGL